jgi:hypothetical protein
MNQNITWVFNMQTKFFGVNGTLNFKLLDALMGRRSRRFFMGAEIPDGYFKYKSKHEPTPLSEVEKMMVITAMMGNTGWHNLIMRGERYAPHLSNYAGSAGGRTFPSAAGFHTVEFFYTDDEGVYFVDTRDAPALATRNEKGLFDFEELLKAHRKRVKKLYDGRLDLPAKVPYIEAHNTWVVNHPSTMLCIPVGDLAQHVLLILCYMLQNGLVLTDDVNRRSIPGIEKFNNIVDTNNVWPLTFVEQMSLSEMAVELSTSCYAGMLTLQAMGLGGWMFDGIDPYSILGTSDVRGLGFRYDLDDRWATPNVTGLPSVFEAHTPPHVKDMKEAVEKVAQRKFGAGGPFNSETSGYYKDTKKVRSSAQRHSEEFKACVSLQAQYLYDTFGKFPATVPSIFVLQYLQAQHIDLDFYDKFYEKGAYLETHSNHMEQWHR